MHAQGKKAEFPEMRVTMKFDRKSGILGAGKHRIGQTFL